MIIKRKLGPKYDNAIREVGAAANGFTSVMMDGSLMADAKSPASYEYNVAVTKEVVDVAHAIGVSVEGELGCLGSLETGMGEAEDGHGFEGKLDHSQLLTDPAEAADFVAKTKVDALAIAIGTSHGAYKFTRKPTGDILAIDRIKEINRRIPNTHLVMHGSSSVPPELLAIINQYGGRMKETFGVPVEEIQEAIKHGVRKINIDTDIRLACHLADLAGWAEPEDESIHADRAVIYDKRRRTETSLMSKGIFKAASRESEEVVARNRQE